jgi:hypothetical protein
VNLRPTATKNLRPPCGAEEIGSTPPKHFEVSISTHVIEDPYPANSLSSLVQRVVVIGLAKRVVAQHLDDAAIGDPPARALHDHAFEFRLQRG